MDYEIVFVENTDLGQSWHVNQHSTVTHFPSPTVTHLKKGGQVGRRRRRDDPSQSFLCRSSLVAFPSLPDEKELL